MNTAPPKINLDIAIRAFSSFLLLAFLFISANAQSATDGSTPLGLTPGSPAGAYPLSDIDTVNLYNGTLNVRLPLLNVGGRGGAGYPITLHLEKKWTVQKYFEPGVGTFYYADGGWWSEVGDGWRLFDAGRLHVRRGGSEDFTNPSCGQYLYTKTLTRITFSLPDGTEYELRDQLTNGQPHTPVPCSSGFNRGRVFVTADGTSATYTADADVVDAYVYGDDWTMGGNSGYLMLRDGRRFRVEDSKIMWMRDRNGNKVTFSYDIFQRVTNVTDSLNREVTIIYPSETQVFTEIKFKGFGGAQRSIKIGQTDVHNALRSDCPPLTGQQMFPELHWGTNMIAPVVNYVELPDGRRYQFQYNSYAEVARIILPTGGAIEYDHAAGLTNGAASGVFSVNDPQLHKYVYRRVIERRVYPAGGSGAGYESKMTYSRPETTTTNLGYVITEQRNNAGTLLAKSQHYFYGSPRASFSQKATHYPAWQDGREYQTDSFNTNGTTVLRRVINTFEQRAEVSWWTGTDETEPPNDVRLKETTATIEPSAANLVSKQTFGYDDSVPFNNQNNVKEYDFGSGTPGTLLRETRTTFVTASNYTGTDVHLRSLPLQVSIHNGIGVKRAQMVSEYDNYTPDTGNLHAALMPRSNISGFCDANPLSCPGASGLSSERDFGDMTYLLRGNITLTTQYLLDSAGNVTGTINGYSQYDVAGNVVKIIDPRSTPTNVIATSLNFSDRFGAPDGEARGNNGATELAGLTSYAYPTFVTNALGHTAYTQFDYYLGQPVDGEDANGIVSSGYYESVPNTLDRPTKVIRAANPSGAPKSQTKFSYDDTNHVITTETDRDNFDDKLLKTEMVYDGLGRTIETRQYEGGSNYIAVQTQYDALGRAFKTSNPFRPLSETAVWTTTAFDALGRVKSVTTPDTASVKTDYSGNRVLVADQNTSDDLRRKRISETDGLGRLKTVWEVTAADQYTEDVSFPDWPSVTKGYKTTYQYDALDNLTQVSQGSQPARTFAYDSLKRLTSANNPESGTVNYQYDNNGNLLVKSDARLVSSHYEYDALNRLARRWYNSSSLLTATTHNSPALPSGVGASDEVKYFYDAQTLPSGAPTTPEFSRGYATGRLVAVTYGGGSNGDYYGYDAAGRIKPKIQRTGGVNYKVDPVYNLSGQATSMKYPSDHAINYNYDNAGRLGDKDAQNLAFTGNLGEGGSPRTYASGLSYSSFGSLQEEKFGTTTPIYHKQRYNGRGQLWDIRASTVPFATDPANGDRGAIVNYYSNSFIQGGSGTDNNGNLLRQENYIPGSVFFQQNYVYDSLNRLSSVAEKLNGTGTPTFTQGYTYDRWGNRSINLASGGVNNNQASVVPSTPTNRMYAPGETEANHPLINYDAAGNQLRDYYTAPSVDYDRTYDAENKLKTSTATDSFGPLQSSYTYDGDGRRIKRNVNGTETWQVYGIAGELLAEYPANGTSTNPQREYGYRNGELLVITETSSGGGGSSAQPVTWTNTVGVSASGNNLTKTAADGWGNAGASSTQSIASGDGYVETTISETNKYRMIGLSNGDSHQNFDDIDFALYPAVGGTLYVYEGGVSRGTFGTYATGDVLRVAVEGGVVKYRKNGTLLYTSAGTPTYPLLVDTSFYSNGATLNNVVISGAAGGGGGSSAQIRWLVADHLGTPRMIFDQTGSLANMSRHDYLPFGEELPSGFRAGIPGYGANDNVRQKFTQKERDNETGLDYFLARYYSATQGRFTSPDPPFADQVENDPQSWNLYSYVRNNPLRYIDPFGDARWELWDDGQEHYVGDYDGEYDKDLNAVWVADGQYWEYQEDVVIPDSVDPGGLVLCTVPGCTISPQFEFEPPMGGGLKIGTKVGRGLLSKFGPRITKWLGFGKKISDVVPTLSGATGREMLRDAIRIVRTSGGTPAEKADLFEKLAVQIMERTGGSWNAVRTAGSDGSTVFVGRGGELMVINPAGDLFRGSIQGGGVKSAAGGVLTPIYDALRKLE